MEFKLDLRDCRISGNELILCDKQIVGIHNFFERQCMLEYVGSNNCNWPDEIIEFVAGRAYEILQEDVDDESDDSTSDDDTEESQSVDNTEDTDTSDGYDFSSGE